MFCVDNAHVCAMLQMILMSLKCDVVKNIHLYVYTMRIFWIFLPRFLYFDERYIIWCLKVYIYSIFMTEKLPSLMLCLSQKKSMHKRESLVRRGWLIKL